MIIKNVLNYFQLRRLRKKLDKVGERYHTLWEDYYDSGISIEKDSHLDKEFTKTQGCLLTSIKSLEKDINQLIIYP